MIRRVLVKFSGEALAADDATLDYHRGFEVTKDHPLLSALPLMEWANPRMVLKLALDVKSACEAGLEVALVIGGGNLCRGGRDTAQRAQRAATDKIGMLATAMNGFLLHLALKVAGWGVWCCLHVLCLLYVICTQLSGLKGSCLQAKW